MLKSFSFEFVDNSKKTMTFSLRLPLASRSSFYKAYHRLNVFLMIACVCPFLQCKRTNRFICKTKYLRFICINILIYLALVSYLSSLEMPSTTRTAPTLYNILEFSHLIGNNYFLFLTLACLLVKRHAHAEFFNCLFQFDRTYKKFIEPPVKYKHINRTFWIELILYGVYVPLQSYYKNTYELEVFSDYSKLIRISLCFEQILYVIVLFHIKNCAHNLIVRVRKINLLLHKFLVKQQQQQQQRNATKYPMANLFRLEQTALMFIILLKAQQSLQTAFGPVFVLIFTFNLFSIAFTAYPFLSPEDHYSEDTPTYLKILDIIVMIPYFFKDFYCMINYHILGNMVSIYRFSFWILIKFIQFLFSKLGSLVDKCVLSIITQGGFIKFMV